LFEVNSDDNEKVEIIIKKNWTLKKKHGRIITKTFEDIYLNVTCAVYCRGVVL